MTVQTFSWSNLTLTLDNGKVLLDDVSGSISESGLYALMGPSGLGKTTLLNSLAFRSKPGSSHLSGDIYINDEEATLNKIKQLSSYVEQEDSLIGSLRVLETVDYSAKFAGINSAHRKDLVEKQSSH